MTDRSLLNRHKTVQTLNVAARSLLQQKLRTFLSTLGVVCGVMAVVAMISVGQGAKMEAVRQIEQLGTQNIFIKALNLSREQTASARERRSPGLNTTDLQRIERGCPMVSRVGCLREVSSAIVGTPTEISPEVIACSANYAELMQMHIASGRFIATGDGQRKNLVCVLGDDVARLLGGAGDSLNFIRIGDHLFKVVGLLRRVAPNTGQSSVIAARNYNEMIFIPLEAAESLIGTDRSASKEAAPAANRLSEIIVQVAHGEDVIGAARLVKRIMEVAHHGAQDYQLVVPLELLDQSQKTQRIFNLVLGSIAGISLLVGGIGIMNIMLATVSERTREIGIRRSVGATRRDILLHFLAEAVILTVSGGMIGLLGGLCAVGVISRLAGWPVALSLWGLLLPLLVSLLVGVFFGLYPARKAAGVDPIVALRHA